MLFIHDEAKPILDEESGMGDLRNKVIVNTNSRSDETSSDDSDDDEWVDGMDRRIDFDYLNNVNSDICAWLYLPDPYVDMPVLQEQTVDYTYYLNHNYEGGYSSSGSLLTPAIPGGLDDAHMLIFGHNMGSYSSVMFSALPRTFCYSDFAHDNPYLYMYYPDRVERWTVYSAANTWSSDIIYDIPYTLGSDDYGSLIDSIEAESLYTVADKPDKNTRTIILSTCTGDNGTQARFYVSYVPDKVKYYDKSESDESSSDIDREYYDSGQ